MSLIRNSLRYKSSAPPVSSYDGLVANGAMVNRLNIATGNAPTMSLKWMRATEDITTIGAAFGNFYHLNEGDRYVSTGMGTATYEAAVQNLGGTIVALPFAGSANSGNIAAGLAAITDEVNVSSLNIKAGDWFAIRFFRTSTGVGGFSYDNISNFAQGDRFTYVGATNQVMGGIVVDTDSAHTICSFPLAVFGRATKASILGLGNSIMFGAQSDPRIPTDLRCGAVLRGVPLTMATLNLGLPGVSLQTLIAQSLGATAVWKYCSHAVILDAINDIDFNATTAAQLIGFNQDIAAMLPAAVKKIACTVGAYTTSVNGWVAPDDQIPVVAAREATKVTYNALVAAIPAGFSDFFDFGNLYAQDVAGVRHWRTAAIGGINPPFTSNAGSGGIHPNGGFTTGGSGVAAAYVAANLSKFSYP